MKHFWNLVLLLSAAAFARLSANIYEGGWEILVKPFKQHSWKVLWRIAVSRESSAFHFIEIHHWWLIRRLRSRPNDLRFFFFCRGKKKRAKKRHDSDSSDSSDSSESSASSSDSSSESDSDDDDKRRRRKKAKKNKVCKRIRAWCSEFLSEFLLPFS